MTRLKLPNRRLAENFDVIFQGMEVQVTFGWGEDGRIKEVFASTRKVGSLMDTIVRDTSVLLSINIQSHATAEVLQRSLTMTEAGDPEGFAGIIVRMIREREAEMASASSDLNPDTQDATS